MSHPKKLKVGICGGGVAGLVCALALSRNCEIEVDVFESAKSFSEVGAGIGVWPRTWAILKELGLEESLLEVVEDRILDREVPAMVYRKSDQASGIEIGTIYAKSGGLTPFYRPDFQNVLLKHISGNCNLHVAKRLESYSVSDSGCITLLFEDRSTADCDVLVGADGIKSATRKTLLTREAEIFHQRGHISKAMEIESSIDPVWSGLIAYRAVIPSDVLHERHPDHPVFTQQMQYLGRDQMIIAYPVAQGRFVNFVGFVARYDLEGTVYNGPWVSTVSHSELNDVFTDWEPPARALVECVRDPLKWAIHTMKPLHSFVSSRDPVVLTGDAGHAMEPFQGNGAGQAIEDAFVLAAVLGHQSTTQENLTQKLAVYDKIRRPFANEIARRSHLAGRSFTLNVADENFNPCNIEDLKQLIDTVKKRWEYAWESTLKLDLDADLNELKVVL